MEVDLDGLAVKGWASQLEGRAHRWDRVNRLQGSLTGWAGVQGQCMERMRQAHQPVDLFVKGLKLFAAGGDDAVAERLQVPLKIGQWRVQLVGGVNDELAPHTLLLVQRLRHLVERVGQ